MNKPKPTKPLLAGVARVNITPPVGTYLQGYARGKPAEGILTELHARALVFDNGATRLALITADLVGLDEPSVKRIRAEVCEKTGIAEDHVMIACSHTHSAQAMMNLCQWVDPYDASTVRETERKLAGAAGLAVQQLRPVRLAYGEGTMDYNINRRRPDLPGTPMLPNPEGVVDRRVKVLRVQAPDQDDPLAVLFLYACHATAMGGSMQINGEHPGMACDFIEHAYHGATAALYLQGCTGDVRPNVPNGKGGFGAATPAECRRLGRRLGAEVLRVCETLPGGDRPEAYSDSTELAATSKRVRLPYAPLPSTAELRRVLRESPDSFEAGWARHVLEEMKQGLVKPFELAEVQRLRVGEQTFVGLPGEPFTELGWRIEELSPSPTLVLGFANANIGYLCTAASFAEEGYEPIHSHPGYSRPAAFTPDIERILVQAATSLDRK